LDCITGLQTARILARRGAPVIALAGDLEHYCCQTRVCERIIAADVKGEALIEELKALGPTLGQKAVLFPCTDMSVLLISRSREQLSRWFHVALPGKQVVETLIDKIGFYTYAAQAGLPIPETFFLRSRTEAEQAAAKLRYPCILKPPIKSAEWERNTNKKVFKLADREEFLRCYDRCAPWAEVLMVQDWVEGPDENLYSCNCYFNRHNEPLVTFIARKLRQWPPETGTSCLGEEVRNDEVLEASLRLFREIGYHGLGYVEMKRDQQTGRHYIIEPNIGRPTGRSAIAEFSGVELVYTMYCDLAGLPLPHNRQQMYRGTKWIYLRRDLQSAFYYWRKGKLSIPAWIKSVWGVRQDAVFSWSDLKPFLADFSGSTGSLLTGKKRRKTAPQDTGAGRPGLAPEAEHKASL
jgi:predicted ATP-grasp superfamily ATP-dependent carboligase